MAKLSELLRAREKLDRLDVAKVLRSDRNLISQLEDALAQVKFNGVMDPIIETIKAKQSSLEALLLDSKIRLKKEIDEFWTPAKTKGDDWAKSLLKFTYEEHRSFFSANYPRDEIFEENTRSRIKEHSYWKHPAMIYHIDTLDYMDVMFSGYPIYIVDKYTQFSLELSDNLTLQQMRKVRFYDTDHLDEMPEGVMGFIISRNHFTNVTAYRFEHEMSWLSTMLAPGGTLLFNFNDCEISGCATGLESDMRNFAKGSQVRDLLNRNGLEVTRWEYISSVRTVWVEAKRPGILESKKRGQALGKIIERPEVVRYNQLKTMYIGLSHEQLVDIMKRENIDYPGWKA